MHLIIGVGKRQTVTQLLLMATVREYRLEAGLSKNDLSKRADVDYATLTRAENGEPIFEYNAQKIAKALSAALGRTITLKDIEGLTVYQP